MFFCLVKFSKVANLLKLKKKSVCWSCRLANCFTKQICSTKLKIKKRYVGKCDGKRVTFKQLKEVKPSTPTATAQITTPAPAEIDSDNDDLAQTFSEMHTKLCSLKRN